MLDEKESSIVDSTPVIETAQITNNSSLADDFSDARVEDITPNEKNLERKDENDFSLTEEEQLRIGDNSNEDKSELIDVPSEPSELNELSNVAMTAEQDTSKLSSDDPYLIQNDNSDQDQVTTSQDNDATAQVNYSYGSRPNQEKVIASSEMRNDRAITPHQEFLDEEEDDNGDNDINGNR